ncbi:MAG: magnesium transporter [Planctomycetes bacterium]|jgi:magnesium transporter|nr:magnesium transporter [Planctomycetota bacterium]
MPDTADMLDANDTAPWEQLERIVDRRDGDALVAFFKELPPEETAYTISHLDPDRRSRMFALLATSNADFGADLLEHFDDSHAADMMEVLPPQVAARLVDEMDSDEQADVLGEVEEEAAAAILEKMDPEEAEDVRGRLDYEDDTAGGLMITEYLAYPAEQDVKEVRRDLRRYAERYNEFEVRYLYGLDDAGKLVGVCPMRSLVMAQPGQPLRGALITTPITVDVHTPLSELEDLFDRVDLMAVPVLDEDGKLAGIVRRAAVQEAISESAKEDLAKFGGIIRGEELRSMALKSRAARRLAFLLPIMLLLMVSATIIAAFEGTVKEVPILAAFLPVVAGLCGSGGGQAVAVSMREISLGLIKPGDFFLVLGKEAAVALVNGVLLGTVLFFMAWAWRGDPWLALVIAGSIPLVMLVAKGVGGTVPLVLRAIGLDPAMASGPVVTTIVDLVSFLTVLLFATLAMARLAV